MKTPVPINKDHIVLVNFQICLQNSLIVICSFQTYNSKIHSVIYLIRDLADHGHDKKSRESVYLMPRYVNSTPLVQKFPSNKEYISPTGINNKDFDALEPERKDSQTICPSGRFQARRILPSDDKVMTSATANNYLTFSDKWTTPSI